ncbi:sortase [Weissella kandleri]|uniref:Sortase n=1 Tax=Weissella kandleri TaxID=1616 RepID=A0A0R2JBY3_9LACO|nr:sortase [Weissella kandleri]KRN74802.1 sortase [Weissella kandleri]
MALNIEQKSASNIQNINKPRKKNWLILVIVLFAFIGGVLLKTHLDNQMLPKLAREYQSQEFKGPVKIKSESKVYSSGSNIPNGYQLKKYHNSSGRLDHRGYIAVPKQTGVTIPIRSMQINEGSSNDNLQNKAMSYGAVTGKANQVMGEMGNFGVEAHTFPDGRTFFSPMQHGIDVNKKPLVYITDGKKLYIYQLNAQKDSSGKDSIDPLKSYDNPTKIPGERIIHQIHGNVMSDEAADGLAMLTMSTCDERDEQKFNLSPVNRIVMTGLLVETKPFNSANESEKLLFPQLN